MTNDEILDFVSKFQFPKMAARERTFFDIGARGYYENPMSDILSFYLDPTQDVHGLGDLVLASLLEILGAPSLNTSTLESSIREWRLDDGKRLDIVLVGDDWVVALENKVWSPDKNDFCAYKDAIERKYSGKSKKFFCLLSPISSARPADGWIKLDTKKFMKKIQEKLAAPMESSFSKGSSSKWVVFLGEFTQNIINVTEPARDKKMGQNEMQKTAENLSGLLKARNFYAAYHNSVQDEILTRISSKLQTGDATSRQQDWGDAGRAIRITPYAKEDYDIVFLTILNPSRESAMSGRSSSLLLGISSRQKRNTPETIQKT